MSELHVGFLLIALLVPLVLAGMHIGTALLTLSFLGIWMIKGDFGIAERMIAVAAFSGIQAYEFATIPLFVLMGMFVAVSDVGKDTFQVAAWLLRRIAGGLGMATVAANAVFAAVTGISIASAAVFSKVAVPEMLRHGYSPAFAVGTVAGSSILGMLIPPSLLLILFGVIAEESIGKLFVAGIVPGIVMALAFMALVFVLAVFCRGFAGPLHEATETAMTTRELAGKSVPIVLLVVLVLGGLYTGIFTPTEAGGVGAFGAFAIALAKRRVGLGSGWKILVETGFVSVAILFLLIAANLYSRMLTLAGIPEAIGAALQGLGPWGFLGAYIVALVGLGMILDSSSILLIVVPIVVPIAKQFGMDMIWFGLITVITIEVGLLTPPFGLSAFTVKASIADERVGLGTVFLGAAPFVGAMFLVLALIVAFPRLVTAL